MSGARSRSESSVVSQANFCYLGPTTHLGLGHSEMPGEEGVLGKASAALTGLDPEVAMLTSGLSDRQLLAELLAPGDETTGWEVTLSHPGAPTDPPSTQTES